MKDETFKQCADILNVELASIKAVAEVESRGGGFFKSGEVKILFEPHVFWKQLRIRGLDPFSYIKGNEDILYPVWGSKKYGKESDQHGRLQRAVAINRDAALSAASWGAFQIMGYNYKLAGFPSLQKFINDMMESEDKHLEAFCNYIINTYLDDELRNKDWAGFARGYNGSMYWKNSYDKKLKSAYEKHLVT